MVPFLALGAVSALSTMWSGFAQAGEAQRKAEEEVRRARLQHQRILGDARATAAASGVESTSTSVQDYISSMAAEFKRQEQWQLDAGSDAASSMMFASGIGAVSDIGKSVFSAGQAYNWWQSPTTSPISGV